MIDDQPLIFYHFHGLRKINRWLYDAELRKYRTRMPEIVRRYVYLPYIEALEHQAKPMTSHDGRKLLKVTDIRRSHAKKKACLTMAAVSRKS
jgi:hypothetical protein